MDPRDPEVRLRALLDPGTLALLAPRDSSGVIPARGRIDGTPVIAFATDALLMGGALGADGCRHIVDAIDAAVRERVPVLGLWHCGGARLAEGVVALDAVGQVFAAMVRAPGRVPQLSVVLGPAAGGAAYGPALTDIVIMSDAGRIVVTGPEVVGSVTGEQVDMARLGGPDPHGRRAAPRAGEPGLRRAPAPAGRLPRFGVGREGGPLRPDVRRAGRPAHRARRRARLRTPASARSGAAWSNPGKPVGAPPERGAYGNIPF